MGAVGKGRARRQDTLALALCASFELSEELRRELVIKGLAEEVEKIIADDPEKTT